MAFRPGSLRPPLHQQERLFAGLCHCRRGGRVVPSGGIGCDGPTLTVRIFSRLPIDKITTLACDVESHIPVALARIVLAERYGITPRLLDLAGDGSDAPAILLIGDKVVMCRPSGMPHQLDLARPGRT